MIYKTFIRFVFLREMTFIRLVNYGEPSYIWFFQKKKKKKIANTSKRCFVYYNSYKFYYIGFTN